MDIIQTFRLKANYWHNEYLLEAIIIYLGLYLVTWNYSIGCNYEGIRGIIHPKRGCL